MDETGRPAPTPYEVEAMDDTQNPRDLGELDPENVADLAQRAAE